MTKYRIKQSYDHEFYPQIKTWLGWRNLITTECHYNGCYDTAVMFSQKEYASAYLEEREKLIAERKAANKRRKTEFPKFFPWP